MRVRPQTYAVTAVTHDRHRLFQRTENAELLLATLLRYRDSDCFLLHGFAIMPDHLHVLLTPRESIEKTAQLIKGGFSFTVRKQFPGEVWQPGYFAHRTTSAEDYEAQLRYIAMNPVRKQWIDYPWVHTTGTWRMDPAPGSASSPRG